MENTMLDANISSFSGLPHDRSCCPLVETLSVELHATFQVHAGHETLYDHAVVVSVVLPV